MNKPVQDAGIGLNLARALGVKGGVRLSLEEAVSPVYVVGQFESDQELPTIQTAVPVTGAVGNVSQAILNPPIPMFVDYLRFEGGAGEVFVRLVDFGPAGVATNFAGDGAYTDGSYPFDISSGSGLLINGTNAFAAILTGADLYRAVGSTIEHEYSDPIRIGPSRNGESRIGLVVASTALNANARASARMRVIPDGSQANS